MGSNDSQPGPATASAPGRVGSLDLLRGLTVLVMLFVNDAAGVKGLPAWLAHRPAGVDGMTLPDVVFPAFLFIVGLALPLAFEKRRVRGETPGSLARHLFGRTLSLLVIGVFMVNTEAMGKGGGLSRNAWCLWMYAGVLLVWLDLPAALQERHAWLPRLRWIGVLALAGAALVYRGPGERSWIELRPQWWGILGLIGWAYLVGSSVYLLCRGNPAAVAGWIALLYCTALAGAVGFFEPLGALGGFVDIGSSLGAHGAITVSGVLAGMWLLPGASPGGHPERLRRMIGYGLMLAAAAVLLHALSPLQPVFTYNKIAATPPWCLLSSAFAVWTWALIYAATDARGRSTGCSWLSAAGQNALFAFILGPIAYYSFAWISEMSGGFDPHARMGNALGTGLVRAAVFALAGVWLTGWLSRRGYRMRL